MWNTVLVRAAEQWGNLDTIPGWGKDHSCHANVRETEPGILKVGKWGATASTGQPLNWYELVTWRRSQGHPPPPLGNMPSQLPLEMATPALFPT